MFALQDESECAICGAPPIPVGDEAILQWCQRYDPEDFAAIRKSIIDGRADQDDDEDSGGRSGGVGGNLSRLAYDSKLDVGIPMTIDDLERLIGVSPECLDILEEAFVVLICGRCSAKSIGNSELPTLLRSIIVHRYGDGDERVARAQPVWTLFERLVQVLQTLRMEADGAG